MEKFMLYNGEIELCFDDKKHAYTVQGEYTPSATQVLGIINKPALLGWAVNCAIEFLKKVIKAGRSYDELEILDMLEEAKGAHRKKKEKAADIGTLAHDWCEKYIKAILNHQPDPEPLVNEQARNCCQAFTKWVSENNVAFIKSERKIYSKLWKYAGTLDIEAIVNGKRCICDLKTGSGIYDEYFMQVASYAEALREEEGTKFEELIIINIKKDGELETKSSDEITRHFNGFLGAKIVWTWMDQNKKHKQIQEAA